MNYAFKTKKEWMDYSCFQFTGQRAGGMHQRSDRWLVGKVSKNNNFPRTLQRDNTENSKQKFPEKELYGLSPDSKFMCL
jgi:hypothetical protein